MAPLAPRATNLTRQPGFGSPSRIRAFPACSLLLCAALAVLDPGIGNAADSPVIFSAIGDAPYGDSEVATFQDHINKHNVYSPSDFFIHLGDIFGGSESCDAFRYQRVADMMHMLTVPAYVIPGDNETTDCADPGSGWQLWTQYFLRFEDYFCGSPATSRQSGRQENFAFVKNGVLFCGINLVGGTNDSQILQDDAAWVTQQLQAQKPNVRAAVIFAQAGPGSNRSIFFDPFVQAAVTFAKPILYIHGDGHSWIMDRPFSGAQNVLRVEVDRGSKPPVKVTVSLDTVNPFQFNRDPWPSGTPAYNRPPCVNAGPDRSIALGQNVSLSGAATDNWVPYNPPRLTYAWTKASGPGTVSFSAPNALATSASFSTSGTYVLRLTANDTALSSSDDVLVFVGDSGSNQPPVAAGDTYEVERDLTLTVSLPGVLSNDSDPEGAPLSAQLVAPPTHGTLSLTSNGSFTYRPNTDYVGQDGFTYRASDGLVTSNLASVTINVGIRVALFSPGHDARVSSSSPTSNYGSSSTLRVQAGSTVLHSYLKFDVSGVGPVEAATLRLYVTDASPDGGSVHAVANTYAGTTTPWTETGINWNNAPIISNPALDAAGAVSVNTWTELDVTAAVASNNTYSFGLDGTSSDPTYYSSKDGSQPPQLVVTYRFGSAANARPVAYDDDYALDEDGSLTVASPGVLGNDTDAEGDPLSASLASGPANGTVALQPTGGFTYTPAANFSGTDWFTYTVSDGIGGTDMGSVALTVNSRPDPPTAANDSYSVVVNNTLATPAPGVLGNDIDPDGEALAASLVTPPSNGSLTLNADGSFAYVPNTDFLGADSFTYRVQDPGGLAATATAAIQVTPPPPVTLTFAPAADAYVSESKPTTNYGTATDIRVRNSRTDYRSYLRFAVSGANAVGGTLVSANLRLHCIDSGSDGGSFYTVSNNYPGTITPWTETGVNWTNGPALGGSPLGSAGAVASGAWAEIDVRASFAGDGTYCYGTLSYSSDQVKYDSKEATSNRPQLVIVIQPGSYPGNTAPVANADSYSLNEDNGLTVAAPGVLGNDTDANADPLSVASFSSPTHGTLAMAVDGSFTYSPQTNYNGPDSFTYTASDGRGGTATATVGLTVNSVNDPPTALADSWNGTAEQALTVAAPGVLANDSDPEGSALSAALVSGVSQGTLTLNANGSFTYTANAGFSGTDSFTYRASDGSAQSAITTVTLTVSGGGGGTGSVTFEEIQSGGSTGIASVTTSAVLTAVSGHLYLAAVATKPSGTVTAVSGLGLTWTRLRSQCAARAQTGVEVWIGNGTPAGGTVTATLQSAPTNAVILAARYSGADPASPVGSVVSGNTLGVNGICSGGTDTDNFSFNLTTAPGSLAFGAVASRSRTVTPGTSYLKRSQMFQGVDSGTMASVSIMDKTASATTTVVDGTISSATDWAVVAVEIRPQVSAAKALALARVELPRETAFRIYPNPFNRGTWIEYTLPIEAHVEAFVYSVSGQRVRTLADERQVAGSWRLYWDGTGDRGADLGAGVYFLRTRLGDLLQTRRIVMVK